MTLIETIILAIIQGITEFLPVSSSGHLVMAQHFFGLTDPEQNLNFIVFLHFTSLLAILVSFYKEIIELLTNFKVILMIIIGTIPAGLIGYLFNDQIDALFTSPRLVGTMLVLTGIYLLISEIHWKSAPVWLERAPLLSALWVGIAQMLSIAPGLSRSGLTICTGLIQGWENRDRVKFSFFLAIPVILGASILKLKDIGQLQTSFQPIHIVIGGLVCFIISLIAINVLVKAVRRGKLAYFGWYCMAVGILTVIFS
ncbi:MAG: undecaprenyl-diphosphate phosphatase [Planctomycetes bacterium]|nr:undecaprenyl-diphosphate phosphatase [Planctomycetota bacterium]